eukprot:COSAG02_NODE_3444_length_6730_cov_14.002262_2_plen_178_part_00
MASVEPLTGAQRALQHRVREAYEWYRDKYDGRQDDSKRPACVRDGKCSKGEATTGEQMVHATTALYLSLLEEWDADGPDQSWSLPPVPQCFSGLSFRHAGTGGNPGKLRSPSDIGTQIKNRLAIGVQHPVARDAAKFVLDHFRAPRRAAGVGEVTRDFGSRHKDGKTAISENNFWCT